MSWESGAGSREEGQAGRTSPSFLIAVLLAVALAGGWTYWRFFRATDAKRSEQVVRELNKDLGRQIGDFRRLVRQYKADLEKGKDVSALLAALQKDKQEILSRIDKVADAAHAKLDDLVDLPLNTHRNRSERIDDKLRDTRAMLEQEAESGRVALTGGEARK